jgi:hypothetical protein
MQLFDPNNPNEKRKMIAAGVLGILSIGVLGYVLFGGSSKKTTTVTNTSPKSSPAPVKTPGTDPQEIEPSAFQRVVFTNNVPAVSEADRNIFAYYEPTPKPTPPPYIPTPTPMPTPPLMISSVSPPSVYARTPADFNLQVMGDKLTAALHIVMDGRDMPTKFVNAQMLTTTVPMSLITNSGSRSVMVRTANGQVYSNTLSITVMPPPTPNYTYVGLIGKPRFNDTAVLQDKSTKDLVNVQRGDVVGGHFRVSSISEKEVVVIDTNLKIKHTIGFTLDNGTNPQFRPPVRSTDDEP